MSSHEFRQACLLGDWTKVLRLISAGAAVNQYVGVDEICLHQAIKMGRQDIYRQLLQLGADPTKGSLVKLAGYCILAQTLETYALLVRDFSVGRDHMLRFVFSELVKRGWGMLVEVEGKTVYAVDYESEGQPQPDVILAIVPASAELVITVDREYVVPGGK